MKPTYEEMRSVQITRKGVAESYIGKSIWYLRACDIDSSGRGYYFPRFMVVDEVVGREFHDKSDDSYIEYKNILRIKVVE